MMKRIERSDIRKQVKIALAGGLVDVELNKDELDFAIDYALSIYRQRAENATKEQGIIFGIEAKKQSYDLSDRPDIINIIGVYRNSIGSSHSTGIELDPFLLQFTNQMMAFGDHNGYGSLATLDFQRQYLELLEVIMAHHIQYYFNKSTNQLTISNTITRDEAILMIAECWRSDEEIFNDPDIKPWITSYSIAKCKQILGEARSKFQSLAGPNGGVTLNGSEMKQEAQAELEALEEQLRSLTTQTKGYPFIMF